MCSIPGLPSPGSNIPVHITRVNLNPLCVLVEFWGNFDQDRKHEYQQMKKEIQSPKDAFHESEGNLGDLCVAQVHEIWYRARIVSRNESKYSVFLIDEGRTLSATRSTLAWGQSAFFHLPPEIEFCVLANVLPLSPEKKWSPMALEFLKIHFGKTLKATVQDVLVPHRTFLLDIPCMSQQMYEMGFAKKLSIERFKEFVARSLLSHTESEPQKISSLKDDQVDVVDRGIPQDYMYPELHNETVETVIITEVTNPHRIFCQLKVFSQELKKLTEQITLHYDGRVGKSCWRPEVLGSPCATRGSDGKWYRSVLQDVMSFNDVVGVLHVDYGKKQLVRVENVRPLAPEFFRMPVVTYMCALHGVINKGVSWTPSQIDFLKSLLLSRTVIAKFEYQSVSEGVYFVTLYGDENTNINSVFAMKEKCSSESEKSHRDFSVHKNTAHQRKLDSMRNEAAVGVHKSPFPTESLSENTSHIAVVQHVDSPAKFWVQTQQHADKFDQLMTDLKELYSNPDSAKGLIHNPIAGLICAVKSESDDFFRALVCKVMDQKAEVYFFDYGNSEFVDHSKLRILPASYQQLPALAMKCKLFGVRQKGDNWNQEAISFFLKMVVNKILDLHICLKSHDTHVVQLLDPTLHGETDISKRLCTAGFAETVDERKFVDKPAVRPLILPTAQDPNSTSLSMSKKSSGCRASFVCVPPAIGARSSFKECMFPIGSSVEVIVSFIDSPNDFWCQTASSAGCLKLLMQDIQTYYTNSEFQPPVEAACVARHPDNGMWYRALIIQEHPSQHVDVLFIDYGQTERVAMQELRCINAAFMKLKGQAFRCSLYNLIHPVSHSSLEWSPHATAQFQEFVDTASSMNVALKCTIYAVMYDAQQVVFNVVDLETPFQSVCNYLVQRGLAERAPPRKAPPLPFRLDTYYYSTHSIKTGSEEEVKVTCVNNVGQFYCHLGRNSDQLQSLSLKVNYLCKQLETTKCPQTFGTVCFAKYTDGEWYRGQIKATKPNIVVHFVDYGDTLQVNKSDLLPIPIEAGEILSVPVQAVECGLSDIPEDASFEVNNWFESYATDRSFNALVVAKEPGGKLIVELYDRKSQVNAKVREKFHPERDRRRHAFPEGNDAQSMRTYNVPDEKREGIEAGRPTPMEAVDQRHQFSLQGCGDGEEQWRREKSEEVRESRVIKAPHQLQRQVSPPESVHNRTPIVTSDTTRKGNGLRTTNNIQNLKLTNLPQRNIKPGMNSEVFVSHCNSPKSFFVQLTSDEDAIYSLVEELNKDQCAEHLDLNDIYEGDLVSAMYSEDSSWYRAVVKEVTDGGTVHVEFIDFGNTAVVSSSRICRLTESFSCHPRFSIHCALSGVSTDGEGQEVLATFESKVVGDMETPVCTFIKMVDTVWEVQLEAIGVSLGFPSLHRDPTAKIDTPSVPTAVEDLLESTSRKICVIDAYNRKPAISVGQILDVYASAIVGPQSFWCQNSETAILEEISNVVQKAGNAPEYQTLDGDSLTFGSACIALFDEDELWYRAKIVNKGMDMLSVLFVDYGNESKVPLSMLKPLPTELLDVPPQAFECQLEGFDVSKGSWNDSAADHFFDLVAEKPLKITVLRLGSSVESEALHFVKLQCNEQIIDELMKDFWRSESEDPSSVVHDFVPGALDFASTEQESASVIEIEEIHEESANQSPISETQSFCLLHFSESEVSNGKLMSVKGADQSEIVDEVNCICSQKNEVESNMEVYECLSTKMDILKETESGKNIEMSGLMRSNPEATSAICAHEGQPNSDLEVFPSAGRLDELRTETPSLQSMLSQMMLSKSSEKYDWHSEDLDLPLNETEPVLNTVKYTEGTSSPPDQSHDDVYDDVYTCVSEAADQDTKQDICEKDISSKQEIKSAVFVPPKTQPETKKIKLQNVQVLSTMNDIHLDSGYLRRATETIPVGSQCVIWSHANKSWCQAKILKISDDSTLVLLIDHDSEMIVDPVNIFEVVPEESTPVSCFEGDAQKEMLYPSDQPKDIVPVTNVRTNPVNMVSEHTVQTQDEQQELTVGGSSDKLTGTKEQLVQLDTAPNILAQTGSAEVTDTLEAGAIEQFEQTDCRSEVKAVADAQLELFCTTSDNKAENKESGSDTAPETPGLLIQVNDPRDERSEQTASPIDFPVATSQEQHVKPEKDMEASLEELNMCAQPEGKVDLRSDTESDAVSEEMLPNEVGMECSSAESFEKQMSSVTHLSLKVEDASDDDVIFVEEKHVSY